jgi:hypothetical protein
MKPHFPQAKFIKWFPETVIEDIPLVRVERAPSGDTWESPSRFLFIMIASWLSPPEPAHDILRQARGPSLEAIFSPKSVAVSFYSGRFVGRRQPVE